MRRFAASSVRMLPRKNLLRTISKTSINYNPQERTLMKVFLDTNIFLEYFERRRQYQYVSQLLSAIEDGRLKAVVSAGCIYTLAYLGERHHAVHILMRLW